MKAKKMLFPAIMGLFIFLFIIIGCESDSDDDDDGGGSDDDDDDTEECPGGQHEEDGICVPDSCGTGTWGDIVTDETTIFVWAGYDGQDSNGTQDRPFTTISAAVSQAQNEQQIAVAKGDYTEQITLGATNDGVTIEGRCPDLVRLIGNQEDSIVEVTGTANLTLTGLAFVNGYHALHLTAATGTQINSNWFTENIRIALAVDGGSDIRIVGNKIESATLSGLKDSPSWGVGIFASSTQNLIVEKNDISQCEGPGIKVQATTGIEINENKIDKVTGAGISAVSCDDITIYLNTVFDVSTYNQENTGFGIWVDDCDGALVEGNEVQDATDAGIYVIDSFSEINDNEVSSINTVEGKLSGTGIAVISQVAGYGDAQVTNNIVADCKGVGIILQNALGQIEGNLVLYTQPHDTLGFGYGIAVSYSPQADVIDNTLTANSAVGIQVAGSVAEISGNVITETETGAGGLFGHGIEATEYSTVTVSENDVTGSNRVGILLENSSGDITGNFIEDTAPDSSEIFGYGIQVSGCDELSIDENIFSGNTGSSVVIDGSDVSASENTINDTQLSSATGLGNGIQVQNQSEAVLLENIITDCYNAGICFVNSTGEADSNEVSNTQTPSRDDAGGDGIAVFAGSDVDVTNNVSENNDRCGVNYDFADGVILQNELTGNHYGAVVQNQSTVTGLDNNTYSGNVEDQAEYDDRVLAVIDTVMGVEAGQAPVAY